MDYTVKITKNFKKNVALCKRRGYPMHLLREALDILIDTGTLPESYRPHILSGNHDGEWEAHISSDWLITWERHDNELLLVMLSTGTHSDLFGKTKR